MTHEKENHYFAMLDERGVCIATLPAPQHGTTVGEDGTIGGQTGAMGIWNGPPKPWCHHIVEVRSPEPWYKVPSECKTVIWKRPLRRYVIYHEENGIYLGSALGFGFWSKLDPAGQKNAITFPSIAAAHNYMLTWPTYPEGCSILSVQIKVSRGLDDNLYATIKECVEAGLPVWDPNAKGVSCAEAPKE
jgi:hypothetical protein